MTNDQQSRSSSVTVQYKIMNHTLSGELTVEKT